MDRLMKCNEDGTIATRANTYLSDIKKFRPA